MNGNIRWWTALVLVGAIAGGGWWRAGLEAVAGPADPSTPEKLPLRLDVLVNGETSAVVTPETPLIITARIVNTAARDAAVASDARARRGEDVDQLLKEGRIDAQAAQWLRDHDPPAPAAQPLAVSVDQQHFSPTDDAGRPVTLPWTFRLVSPAPRSVRLDGKLDQQVVLAGTPNVSSPPKAGAVTFVLSFENQEAGAGRWTGTLRSAPLTITVKPALATAPERAASAIAVAEFALATGDIGRVATAAAETLREDPRSARGHFLQGIAREAQGDFQGALEAYQTAAVEARRSAPSAIAPWELPQAIRRMWDKLGITADIVR